MSRKPQKGHPTINVLDLDQEYPVSTLTETDNGFASVFEDDSQYRAARAASLANLKHIRVQFENIRSKAANVIQDSPVKA